MSQSSRLLDKICFLLGLKSKQDTDILQIAGSYGIQIESNVIYSLQHSIPIYLSDNEDVIKCLSCIVGLIVHFHCIYHTPAFKPTYTYNSQKTLHARFGTSINQLVSISMMSQAFQCLFNTSSKQNMYLYDTINNNLYQPQCREYENSSILEKNLSSRAHQALKLCCNIIKSAKKP